jgi:hypothetical protein
MVPGIFAHDDGFPRYPNVVVRVSYHVHFERPFLFLFVVFCFSSLFFFVFLNSHVYLFFFLCKKKNRMDIDGMFPEIAVDGILGAQILEDLC